MSFNFSLKLSCSIPRAECVEKQNGTPLGKLQEKIEMEGQSAQLTKDLFVHYRPFLKYFFTEFHSSLLEK